MIFESVTLLSSDTKETCCSMSLLLEPVSARSNTHRLASMSKSKKRVKKLVIMESLFNEHLRLLKLLPSIFVTFSFFLLVQENLQEGRKNLRLSQHVLANM